MPKDAGYYSDRITLLRHSATPSTDGSGAVLDVWTDDRRVWCRIEQPKGSDRVYYGGLQTAVDCVVRVRGTTPISGQDRFRTDDGRTLVIDGVHREDYDLVCACVQLGESDGHKGSYA